MFNNEQLKVMCNIIAAVESEGQVYHTRETSSGYGTFTEAYENTSNETAITLGRYQHYAREALRLLRLIYSKDKTGFTKELLDDMNTKNWDYYAIARNSEKAKAIIKIISSKVGKECQDQLVGEQMQEYAKTVEARGVKDVWAQAMCVNFIHQGGLGAFTRILAKTPKTYTLDDFYNASKSDTGNQVGAYRQRQTCVYNFIKKYMPKGTATKEVKNVSEVVYDINPGTSADEILNIMRSWLGLSKANQTHRTIIDTYNSYLPHPRGYAVTYYDDYCATTVSAAFIKAKAVDLIGGIECGVDRFIEDCFKPKGIWIEDESRNLPQKGDIICFNWDSNQPNSDNTGFADHIGIVESVSGGIITTIEGNTSGGVVARKQYPTNYGFIRGYARPCYNQATTTATMNNQPVQKPVSTPKEEQTASSTAPSKVCKFYGIVIADVLNIRTWPGTSNPRLKSYPQLPYGTRVEVCDTVNDTSGNPWYYIRINNSIYGFASAEYIQKI